MDASNAALHDQDLAQTLLDLNAAARGNNSSSRTQILAGTFQPGAAPRVGAQYQVADLPVPKSRASPTQNGHPK